METRTEHWRVVGRLRLALLTIGIVLGVRCASAASVLYGNGLFNGNIGGWTINSGFQVADSFTLAGSSTLTGVSFAAWVSSEDAAQTVDWAIVGDPANQVSTTFYSGSDTPLGSTFLLMNGFGFDVYNERFDLASLSLGAGTYWLVLMNGTTAQSDVMLWDENDGPSQAWESTLGFLTVANNDCTSSTSGNCSEAFQVLGTSSEIPEPSTLTLGASGLLLVAAALRQNRRSSSRWSRNNRLAALQNQNCVPFSETLPTALIRFAYSGRCTAISGDGCSQVITRGNHSHRPITQKVRQTICSS
jgi:hypothetical protein